MPVINQGALPALPIPPRVKSLIGRRFGKLRVRAYGGSTKWGKTQWCCECDCGAYCLVPGRSLLAQDKHRQVSCGCSRSDPNVRWQARMKIPATKRKAICTKMRGRWGGIRNSRNDLTLRSVQASQFH